MIPTRSPGSTPLDFSSPAACALAPSRNLYGSSVSSSLTATLSGCSEAVSVRTVARLRLMRSSLRGGFFLPLLQLLLEDLAGRVARQLVEELHVARDLVARQVGLHLLLDLVLRRPARPLGHDKRLQALAELLVVDADDGHL